MKSVTRTRLICGLFILLVLFMLWPRREIESMTGSLNSESSDRENDANACPLEDCPAGCVMPAWVTSDCSVDYEDGMGGTFRKCPYLCKSGRWNCITDECCRGCGHAIYRTSAGTSPLTPGQVFGAGSKASHDLKILREREQLGGQLSPGPGMLPTVQPSPPQPAPLTLYSMTPIHQATVPISEDVLIERSTKFNNHYPDRSSSEIPGDRHCRLSATGIFRDCGPVGAGPDCLG